MRVLTFLIFSLSLNLTLAQVGIGTSTPNEATILDINSLISGSARGGLGLPVVANDTERDQINTINARSGILIYHAGDRQVQIFDAENGNWEVLFSLPAVNNSAPTATVNSPTGTTTVGETLTADYTYNDADSDPEGATTFQWIRADDNTGTNAASISGATGETYTLTQADANNFIAVDVTPVAQSGNNNTMTTRSAYVGPITAQSSEINFVQQNQTIAETADTTADDIDLQFSLSQVIGEDITVTVSASDYTRLDESAPVDIIIPASSTSPYTASAAFNVADDALQNGDETITFTITAVSNASSTTTIGATDTDTVVVEDDDGFSPVLQDFDSTNSWTFTNSPATYNVSDDVWSNVSSLSTISTLNGNFWGMRDLDNPNGGGSQRHDLTFATIDTSSATGVVFSYDYESSGLNVAADRHGYELFYDGVSQGEVDICAGCNTAQDGTISVNIPDAVNSVYVIIYGQFDGGTDIVGVDNVRLQ